MAGNVAEWTSTSYSESGPSQMSDMNPDLRYNAAKEDPYAMKKKVVRGGSWKDVAQFIRSDMRTFEYQNETRSYIVAPVHKSVFREQKVKNNAGAEFARPL